MSSNSNQTQPPELTLEQRRKLITSIRPNGRVRPIPADSTAEISYEDINPGDEMTNFHNEYAHGRYYRRENFMKIMNSNPTNPQTREPIETFSHYIASINGNTGGIEIQVRTRMYINLDENEIEFHRTPDDGESQIYANEGYIIVNPLKPFHSFISKYIQEEATYNDVLPIEQYVYLFGIREGESSFLLNPLRMFIDRENEPSFLRSNSDTDHEEIFNYLSQPLSSLLGSSEGITLHMISRTPLFENLNLTYPEDIIRTPQEKTRFQNQWRYIRQSIFNDILLTFRDWLQQHHDEYQSYTEFKFSSEMGNFIGKMRAEIDELARNQAIVWKEQQLQLEREARQKQREKREKRQAENDRFHNKYEGYYRKYGGVRRKTRRIRKISKRTMRKN